MKIRTILNNKLSFGVSSIFLLCLFSQSIFAQKDKPLPNIETVVKEKCNSTAQVVLSSYPTIKVGHIYLLMEERDFTQSNLKNFFTCIAGEYPKLNWLEITALSDRKELDFQVEMFLHPPPSEEIIPSGINTTKPPNHYRTHYQRWNVIGSGEYFEYSPDPKNWKMVTYTLRKTSTTRFRPLYSGNLNEDLMEAVFQGDIKKIKSLSVKGADVNYRDDSGDSVLMVAVNLHKPIEVIRLLLDKEADVNAQNKEDQNRKGNTALIYAAGFGSNVSVLKLLLKQGANVNAQEDDGYTALMYEAGMGSLEGVKLLVANGADISIKNKKGETALQIALKWGNEEVADFLLTYERKSKAY